MIHHTLLLVGLIAGHLTLGGGLALLALFCGFHRRDAKPRREP